MSKRFLSTNESISAEPLPSEQVADDLGDAMSALDKSITFPPLPTSPCLHVQDGWNTDVHFHTCTVCESYTDKLATKARIQRRAYRVNPDGQSM